MVVGEVGYRSRDEVTQQDSNCLKNLANRFPNSRSNIVTLTVLESEVIRNIALFRKIVMMKLHWKNLDKFKIHLELSSPSCLCSLFEISVVETAQCGTGTCGPKALSSSRLKL